jgi:hypothetical protein
MQAYGGFTVALKGEHAQLALNPTVRCDPNDSVARSPAGSTLGSTLGSIFSRRVKHGDDAGEWVDMTGTRCNGLVMKCDQSEPRYEPLRTAASIAA